MSIKIYIHDNIKLSSYWSFVSDFEGLENILQPDKEIYFLQKNTTALECALLSLAKYLLVNVKVKQRTVSFYPLKDLKVNFSRNHFIQRLNITRYRVSHFSKMDRFLLYYVAFY